MGGDAYYFHGSTRNNKGSAIKGMSDVVCVVLEWYGCSVWIN